MHRRARILSLKCPWAAALALSLTAAAAEPHAQRDPKTGETATLVLAGDTMLGRLVNEKIGKEGYAYPWGDLIDELRSADLAIVNLETTLTSSRRKVRKVFNFKADPDRAQCLVEAGIGCTDNEPGWKAAEDKPGTFYVPVHRPDSLVEAVRGAALQADVVVVTMHWGPNMRERPPPSFRELAHRLIDAGAEGDETEWCRARMTELSREFDTEVAERGASLVVDIRRVGKP